MASRYNQKLTKFLAKSVMQNMFCQLHAHTHTDHLEISHNFSDFHGLFSIKSK